MYLPPEITAFFAPLAPFFEVVVPLIALGGLIAVLSAFFQRKR